MMVTLLLTAALVGPGGGSSSEVWRDEYRSVLKVTSAHPKSKTEAVVLRLVRLYVSLQDVEVIPRSERTSMQTVLRSRLVTQLEYLLKERREHESASRRLATRRFKPVSVSIAGKLEADSPLRPQGSLTPDSSRPPAGSTASAGHAVASNKGGAAIPFAAQQLIDLIVTTIAPDSWRQNGGGGTITYYARNPALIIRQTSEVHEEAAALLNALRDQ